MRDVARAPHQFDVVEQRDQREDADKNQQHRAEETQAEITRELSVAPLHGQLVAKRWVMRSVSADSRSVMTRGRLQDQAMPDHVETAPAGPDQRDVLQRQDPREVGAEHGGDESDQAQQAYPADRADHRHGAALPVGARGAKIGEGDDGEGDRVERSHQPVMQLGAELSRLLDIELVIRIRPKELPEIALADRIFHRLRAAGELRQIERIAVEHHHCRVALIGGVALHDALLQDQERAGVVVDQLARFAPLWWCARPDCAGRRGRCRAIGRCGCVPGYGW